MYSNCLLPRLTRVITLDWYDNEHAPARLTVPGIISATRYKATDKQNPEWLAIYDLTSPEITKSPTYLSLRDKASQNEREIIPRLPILQRRTYSLINEVSKPDLPPDSLPGKHLLAILSSFPKELDGGWHQDEPKTPPGWLRTRRYKLVDAVDLVGQGPTIDGLGYLVLHEWDRDSYAETPESETSAAIVRKFTIHKDFSRI